MNQTIKQITPETLALIERQAKISGVSVDEYLRSLLPNGENGAAIEAKADVDEFEKDMDEFAEEIESDYNSNYSREDIYFDHD